MSCCDSELNAVLMTPALTKLVAAVVMIDEDGRILLAQRPDHVDMSGLWEFPGGKIIPGETPEVALVREVKEELGVTICAGCLAPVTFLSYRYTPQFHLVLLLYSCRMWKGIVQGQEGQWLKWIMPCDLGKYALPDANKPLISMLPALL